MSIAINNLTAKLARLPADRLDEIANFVDFIAEREHERRLMHAGQMTSQAALAKIWSNDADAAYDHL